MAEEFDFEAMYEFYEANIKNKKADEEDNEPSLELSYPKTRTKKRRREREDELEL